MPYSQEDEMESKTSTQAFTPRNTQRLLVRNNSNNSSQMLLESNSESNSQTDTDNYKENHPDYILEESKAYIFKKGYFKRTLLPIEPSKPKKLVVSYTI